MTADPRDSCLLTENPDASGLPDAAAAIAGAFNGELDGIGYKI